MPPSTLKRVSCLTQRDDSTVSLMPVIVNKCHTLAMMREQTEEFIQAVRILRVAEGADIIVKRMFDEFEGDPLASWLMVLDEVMRGLGEGSADGP